MKILVACEESQAVTIELRKLGHEAYSCDIIECSGGHPEWHLQQDVIPLLKEKWDMIIAFPPCTDLASSGARHFAQKRADGRQQRSIDFFMAFANADCERIAIENPVGIMSTKWRKPDQIIQPWQFALTEEEKVGKSTCLWLKGLNHLDPRVTERPELSYHEWTTPNGKKSGKIFGITKQDVRLPPKGEGWHPKPFPASPKLWQSNGRDKQRRLIPMPRITKDEYYLNIALAVARRSTCLRRQYGAVIVKDDCIISTGYNGSARGEPNCCDVGMCWRQQQNIPHGQMYEKCVAVHAEDNAISQAGREAIGATLYLAGLEDGKPIKPEPCLMCERKIKNARIAKVITEI